MSEQHRASRFAAALRRGRRPITGAGLVFMAAIAFLLGGNARSADHGALVAPKLVATNPQGYWLSGSDGGIFAFGGAAFQGSAGSIKLNQPIVGMTATRSSNGYWFVASDGGIFSYGDARFFGSAGSFHLNKPIVGMAATPTGNGYWLVASDGGIFAFGDAGFFGSAGSIKLNKPIVGMAATPTGNGYWLVASDGGIFTFGDAGFFGSAGSIKLNKPIVALAPTSTGNGYWFVASDGGIFNYGDAAFFGSAGGSPTSAPIVGMGATPLGAGYWLVGADGNIYNFGDAGALGNLAGSHLNKPIVGMAAPLLGSSIPSQLAFDTAPAGAVSGSTLNDVTVRVLDANNNFLSSSTVPVTLSIASGPTGAVLSGTGTRNAASGIATFAGLSLDKAGTYTVAAASPGLTPATSPSFTITAAPATKLLFGQAPTDTASGVPMSPAVTVRVADAAGNTVPSATNTVTVSLTSPGSSTLGGTLNAAAVNGVATFSDLTVDKVGTYNLQAVTSGLTSVTSAAFAIVPGIPTHLAYVAQPTDTVSLQNMAPVTVRLLDAANNVATNDSTDVITVGLTGSPTGVALGGTPTRTVASGVATFDNLTVDKVGSYTLTATSGALTPLQSATFAISPGAATKVAFAAAPANTVAGTTLAPAPIVQIQDAAGNVVTSAASTIALAMGNNAGAGTLAGTVSKAASAGQATFTGLSINKTGAGYTLVASSGSLTNATSSSFDITPGTATHLVFGQQPTSQTGGIAIAPAVTVRILDANDNLVTGATAPVTMVLGTNPGGAGTLSGTTSRTPANGVATFDDLSITKAANGYTLTAAHSTLPTVDSSPFNITVGQPTKLAFSTQPPTSAASAATLSAVVVQIQDAGGNLVTTATDGVALALNPSTGGLTGTTSKPSATGGQATFNDLKVAKTGTYTLVATATGLTDASSSSFTITPGTATKLAFGTAPANATAAPSTITPAVTVEIRDAQDNVVTTATDTVAVAFGTNPGSATLGGTVSQAAVNGVATFANLTVDKAANGYTLTATSGTLSSVTSPAFNVAAGPADHLVFTTQPTNSNGGAVMSVVRVAVVDTNGNTVPGATNAITMTIGNNAGSGTLTGTNPVNAASGVAAFADLVLDKAGTGYTLTATTTGLPGSNTVDSAAFNVTVGPAAKIVFTNQPNNTQAGSAIVGVDPTAPAGVKVAIEDAGGNIRTSDSSTSVAITLIKPTGNTATLSPSPAQATVTNGVARFANLSIDKTGTGFQLHAATTSFSVDSQAFTILPGPAATIAYVVQPGDTASGSVIQSPGGVKVKELDANNNIVTTDTTSTITVALTNAQGATLMGNLTRTLGNGGEPGVAAFTDLAVDKVGTYTLTATRTGLPNVVSNSFQITPGPATKLAFPSAISDSTGGTAIPQFTVQVRDANNNTVTTDNTTSISLSLSTNPSGGHLTGTTSVANVTGGIATFNNAIIDKAGNGYQLQATTPSGHTSAVSSAFNVNTGSAAKLGFLSQPTDTATGGTITPAVTVEIQDAGGNRVTSSNATVTLLLNNASVGGPGVLTGGVPGTAAVGGVATFNNLTVTGPGTAYTLAASSGNLGGGTSTPFNVYGAPSQLGFGTQPQNSTAGQLIPDFTVEVRDAGGRVVRNATNSVTVAITSGTGAAGATLTGTKTATPTNSDGVVTFTGLSIDKAANGYSFTATATGLTNGVSNVFNVVAGTPAKLAFFAQPSSTQAGSPINGVSGVKVEVQDAGGNRVTSATTAVTLAIANNPASGTLSGTNPRNAVSGVATFDDLSINKAGTGYTLLASASGLTQATSAAFPITPGAASQLSFTTQPQNTTGGTPFASSVQVSVLDSLGNVVTSSTAPVTVGITSGTGDPAATLSGTATQNASSGVATFPGLSIDKATGTAYSLTATSGSLTNATSSVFTVSVGPAAKLVYATQPSNVAHGVTMTPAVQVAVTDAGGNVITSDNRFVALAIKTGTGTPGATLTGGGAIRAVNGIATFSGLQINQAGTGYQLTATAGSFSTDSSAFNVT